jgi:hypothetical protein
MPAVVPGAIIEYRWREVRENALADRIPLYFNATFLFSASPISSSRTLTFPMRCAFKLSALIKRKR